MSHPLQFAVLLAIATLSSSACKESEETPLARESVPTAKQNIESEIKSAPTVETASKTKNSLVLAKLTLASPGSDDDTVMTIREDGKVIVAEDELAAIAPSGEMRINGKVVSILAKDGTLSFTKRDGTMYVSESGEVKHKGEVINFWNEDGTLGGEATKHTQLNVKYEGAPEHRRVASYAILAGIMIASGSPESAWLAEPTVATPKPHVVPAASP